jgi:hypothetical protein
VRSQMATTCLCSVRVITKGVRRRATYPLVPVLSYPWIGMIMIGTVGNRGSPHGASTRYDSVGEWTVDPAWGEARFGDTSKVGTWKS